MTASVPSLRSRLVATLVAGAFALAACGSPAAEEGRAASPASADGAGNAANAANAVFRPASGSDGRSVVGTDAGSTCREERGAHDAGGRPRRNPRGEPGKRDYSGEPEG